MDKVELRKLSEKGWGRRLESGFGAVYGDQNAVSEVCKAIFAGPSETFQTVSEGEFSEVHLPAFCSVVPRSLGPSVVGCSGAIKIIGGDLTAYLSEEQQRQRVRELVRKNTGMDWPELTVGDIQKAMSSVTLFYWCTKEDVGKRGHQKQLELTDEETNSIAIN